MKKLFQYTAIFHKYGLNESGAKVYLDSELIIEFDEKYTLELFISIHTSDGTFIGFNSSDRDLRDMSYWELFMPNNRIIEFYPDLTWSDQPSDVLVEELVNT